MYVERKQIEKKKQLLKNSIIFLKKKLLLIIFHVIYIYIFIIKNLIKSPFFLSIFFKKGIYLIKKFKMAE